MRKYLMALSVCVLLSVSGIAYSANDITGGTWIIDTAGVVSSAKIKFVWIYWTGITTDGHQIVINEYPSGRRIIKAAGLAGVDMGFPFPGTSGMASGIIVQTFGSGEIQIRMGKP